MSVRTQDEGTFLGPRLSGVSLLFRPIEDRLRAVHDLEICRQSEQRRAWLRAHDVCEAKRLLPHAWIAPFAVNHSLEIGRCPDLRNNRNSPLIPYLSCRYRVRRTYSIYEDAFHGLRTKVLCVALILLRRNQMFFKEHSRCGSSYGGWHGICLGRS